MAIFNSKLLVIPRLGNLSFVDFCSFAGKLSAPSHAAAAHSFQESVSAISEALKRAAKLFTEEPAKVRTVVDAKIRTSNAEEKRVCIIHISFGYIFLMYD